MFWGTAWTPRTLLARELREAKAAEKLDGVRRVFLIDANIVSREVPAYGKFVMEQVARLGRQHPLIKTQLFSEEMDGEGGMFPARRLALLAGSHPRMSSPRANQIYALLVDVAGEDEGITRNLEDGNQELANPRRDSTAVTVIEIELDSLADPLVKAPSYRIVDRTSWTGIKHTALYGKLKGMAELWQARYLVVDATGVGAGLASFLDKALPGRVIPYVFNGSTKSKLGWELLGLIETGRLKDYAAPEPEQEQAGFIEQLQACQMEIIPGPERKMKWGVPDGQRNPITGETIHDDWITSAALAAVLDAQSWAASGPSLVVRRRDPIEEMDREGY